LPPAIRRLGLGQCQLTRQRQISVKALLHRLDAPIEGGGDIARTDFPLFQQVTQLMDGQGM